MLARATGGARFPLQRVLFTVAVAGRKTASSRDSGCAQDGAGGMTCQGCCGIGGLTNGSLDAGCVPRMRRTHIVVLPALRGWHAFFNPTADCVEFKPQVEHQSVSSESHIVWSGEWRMQLK